MDASSLTPNQKEGKYEKKIQEITMEYLSGIRILSKAQLEWTLPNNKKCTPRYLYGEYSQLLLSWIQSILFKNKCNHCAAEIYLEPSRKSTMKYSCKNS